MTSGLVNQMPVSLLALPVTFDLAGVNYEVTDFVISRSSADPGNAANNAKKTTKPAGAETQPVPQ
ncbi:MAG: hypothetical protein IPL50_07710 [Chitinophagaceae bacterium]|nr:hypothetical protein [Chitinophagaceae bacterium]